MNLFAVLFTLSVFFQPADEAFDLDATAAKYEAECAAGAAGASCDDLRAALEDHLFDCLVELTNAGQPVDRETVRTATRAMSPTLAAYALALLDAGFGPGDVPYVRTALDSPYPSVRAAAIDLSKWFETDALSAPTKRARAALENGYPGSGYSLLIPDPVPTAESLHAPLYPGASYSYLAGSLHQPVFLSADAPQKVAAQLAKGRPVRTAAQMTADTEARAARDAEEKSPEEEMAAAMAQAAEMLDAMEAGKDPTKVAMEMSQAKDAGTYDWTAGITDMEGIAEPLFVVAEEKQGVPTRVVAVFRDSLLGATAIAYLKPPGNKNGEVNEMLSDPEQLQRWSKWQSVLEP